MGTTPRTTNRNHACTKQAGFWWKVSTAGICCRLCIGIKESLSAFCHRTTSATNHYIHEVQSLSQMWLRFLLYCASLLICSCITSPLIDQAFYPIIMEVSSSYLSVETCLHVLMSCTCHTGFSKRQKRAITIMCFDSWDHHAQKTLHFVLWEPLQTVLWHVKFQSHAVRSSIPCQPWVQAWKNARPKRSR